MNRAEKRRMRKLAEKAANYSKPAQPASPSLGQQTPAIQQAIDLALQHHGAGRLPEAESIYQRILQADPNHPVALHMLGVIAHQVGKNGIAADLITKALAIEPDYAEAHSNLGLALQKLGRLDDAVASYGKALVIKQNFAEAHNNLGNALQDLGRLDEAVASYHKALAIKPDFADTHNNLGNVLQELGELDEAVASYRKALAIKPDYAEAYNNLGQALQGLEKIDEAVASYSKALAIKPEYAEAHNNLGLVLRNLGKLDGAVACFHKALAIKPDHAEAHSNLGYALTALGKLDEAVASYSKALAIKPEYVEAHNNLGLVLRDLGKPDGAVASFHKALAIKPEYAEAHNNLGLALQDLGKLDEAVACYRKAFAIRPDYAEALFSLCEIYQTTNRTEALRKTVNEARQSCPDDPRFALREAQLLNRDGNFAAARAVLEATGEGVADASFLSVRKHLLGNLCDRLDDSRAAYNYFREGNRRSRDIPEAKRVDGRAYLARTDALEKRFTSDWVKGWRSLESNDGRSDPVFLVGFPRSGTTLLDTILSSHPTITVVEESSAVRNMRIALGQLPGGYPDGLATLDPADRAGLRQIYFTELDKQLEPQDQSAMVIDKLPLNTVEAGLIHRIFPGARFLFAQRHPCDCVLSCFMQNFQINEAMVNFLDLEDAARLYDKVMALWQQYRAVLPLEVHAVRYESLVVGFEETLNPLLDFLGVGWDDGVRNYAETAFRRGMINTPSYDQVTQPLYTRSSGRWQRYREQMQPVLPVLLPWAKRFGYDE